MAGWIKNRFCLFYFFFDFFFPAFGFFFVLGFFFGFALGAQTLHVLFGAGFLATITGWVVGFLVGALFAVLSYLFYFAAVALLSGAFGYALAVGLLGAIGLDFGFLVWIIGIIAAVVVAAVVLFLNIQKYAVIIITAVGGTSVIIFTLLAAFGKLSPLALLFNPVQLAIQNSFWWLLFFLVLAFTFFYTLIVFSQTNIADNLRKSGGFIPGYRPGPQTERLLNNIVTRLTLLGAVFLAVVAVLPFFVGWVTGIPQLTLRSTGLLIVVGVAVDTMKQLDELDADQKSLKQKLAETKGELTKSKASSQSFKENSEKEIKKLLGQTPVS